MDTFFEFSNKNGYFKFEPDFTLLESHFPNISNSFINVFNFEASQNNNYSIVKHLVKENGIFISSTFVKEIESVLGKSAKEIPTNIFFLPIYVYAKTHQFTNYFNIKTVVKQRLKETNSLIDVSEKLLNKGCVSIHLSFNNITDGKKIEIDNSILIDPKFKTLLAETLIKYHNSNILIRSGISDNGLKKKKVEFTSLKKELAIDIHSYLENHTSIKAINGKTSKMQIDLIGLYFNICGLINSDEDTSVTRENILRYITR